MRLWLAGLLGVLALSYGGIAKAQNAFPLGIHGGYTWPQSGVLDRYWNPGPTFGLDSYALSHRQFDIEVGIRYSRLDSSSEGGYVTHGAALLATTVWYPTSARRLMLRVHAGVAGYWTGDLAPETTYVADGGRGRPPVGKIHGWGPSVGPGLGFVFARDEGATFSVVAEYDRRWASDGFLDTFTISLLIFVSSVPGSTS